jgi:NADH dehydrogenase
MAQPLHVVTGALGYTGRSLTEQLLARGDRVRTLTNSPDRPNPFADDLEIHPLAFDDPDQLAKSLDGVNTLYNTYWVRFNHKLFTFEQAVTNTKLLFDAAKRAGVQRIVHVSILHADRADDLGYYRGKHELEDALRGLGVEHSIVRPGVLFGRGDILVNNIAWALRHMPIMGVFGDGYYELRPLHVDDMAALMIRCADGEPGACVDAVGPERFMYRELIGTLGEIIGVPRPVFSVPARLGWAVTKCLDPMVRDTIITWEEVLGLMRGLLDSEQDAAGDTKLTEWAARHRDSLGTKYANEVGRRIERARAYAEIS